MHPPDDRYERFVETWRREAGEPPRLDSGRAARRILDRISHAPSPRRPRPAPWLLAAAGVLVCLLAILLPSRAPRRTVRRTAFNPPPGVMVFWLDKTTPLYMNLAPKSKKGENS